MQRHRETERMQDIKALVNTRRSLRRKIRFCHETL